MAEKEPTTGTPMDAPATGTKGAATKDAPPVDSGRRNNQGLRLDQDGNVLEETGAAGMSLGNRGEHAGGGLIHEHTVDAEPSAAQDPLYLQRRYASSRLAKEAGPFIGRGADEIGLWGKGMTYHGIGILIDVDTMEKHRIPDGFKFEGDEVYANSRDLPHALVQGDIAKNISGESAPKQQAARQK